MGSRETREIRPETMKKPVDFVGSINWATDCVKLIIQGLEGMGIGNDWTGATLHQLEVIFERNFTGLGAVAKGVFQGGPYLTGCGKANNFSHCFLYCLASERWGSQIDVVAQGCHPHDPINLDSQGGEEVDSSIKDSWRRRA